MKKMILVIAVTLLCPVFAQATSFFATNMGTHVETVAWNTSDKSVWCVGTIYMKTESGDQFTAHVSELLSANEMKRKRVMAKDMNDKIADVYKSVDCR